MGKKIEFWNPDVSIPVDINDQNLIKKYGKRPVTLARLANIAEEARFFVPHFKVIPVTFSKDVNDCVSGVLQKEEPEHFLVAPSNRIAYCKKLIRPLVEEFLAIAHNLDPLAKPIIRGSSVLEGMKGLSFAGVCLSAVPKAETTPSENILSGAVKVLTGSFTPYADYYFSQHSIPDEGRSVSITLMELVSHPEIHATAYVYPDEIRIKYFIAPTVGGEYIGGHELFLQTGSSIEEQLKSSIEQKYHKVWADVVQIFVHLYRSFYENPTPLDIEFLVSDFQNRKCLQIVQVRPISRPHMSNYHKAVLLKKVIIGAKKIASKSFLNHTVGIVKGQIVDLREGVNQEKVSRRLESKNHPIFVIRHLGGTGTFSLLKSLPFTKNRIASVLIAHPPKRIHDHLQYAVFEDDRFRLVAHCAEEDLNELTDNTKVELTSTGENVYLKQL